MTAILKNGFSVDHIFAMTISLTLKDLKENHPKALWELAMKCKDASHVIKNTTECNAKKELKTYGLLHKKGHISDGIKNIVLSAIGNIKTIESIPPLSICLVNPIKSLEQTEVQVDQV